MIYFDKMKTAGSWNIAQDEESCVVFGMPAEAIKTIIFGAVVRTRLSHADICHADVYWIRRE